LFDILRDIDGLLGRIATPLTCPSQPQTTTTTTTLPGCTCSGGPPSIFSFVTGIGGTGTCGHLDADGNPNFFSLTCGGLYFGGAGVAVPLPSRIPDRESSITKVSCTGTTLTLQPASAAEAEGNRCTQRARSVRGTARTPTVDCA